MSRGEAGHEHDDDYESDPLPACLPAAARAPPGAAGGEEGEQSQEGFIILLLNQHVPMFRSIVGWIGEAATAQGELERRSGGKEKRGSATGLLTSKEDYFSPARRGRSERPNERGCMRLGKGANPGVWRCCFCFFVFFSAFHRLEETIPGFRLERERDSMVSRSS